MAPRGLQSRKAKLLTADSAQRFVIAGMPARGFVCCSASKNIVGNVMASTKIAILLLAGLCAAATAQPADRAAITVANAAEREREARMVGAWPLQTPGTAYDIGKPGNVNYDEDKAQGHPNLPDVLTLKNGTKVTNAAQWKKRAAEIRAMFDTDVFGKYPANLPKVTWRVTGTEQMDVQGIPAIVKHATGHVENARYPAIALDIQLDVVTPAAAKGRRVPMILGGGSVRPRPTFPSPPPGAVAHMTYAPVDVPDSAKLLLQRGWGFVWINATDIQPDNGASFDKGIIGLMNKGQPRKSDDWGVLRAWAWADSRALDYLQTDPDVDGTRVGIFGHSRFGKGAIVAMADDPRFAIGFISSSGEGGVNLFRRNYGQTVNEALGPSDFHWFAANLMRYAAPGHSAEEMPFDAHEFVALVAPRPIFVGAGVTLTDAKYVPGDGWVDARGMFMAEVAASPVWTLLGGKGIGTTTFPPVGSVVDSGDVAFRQHEYGHTPAPNWPWFIRFAGKYFP
jgi:hypothetical protein